MNNQTVLRSFYELNMFMLTAGGPSTALVILLLSIIGQIFVGVSLISVFTFIAIIACRSVIEWSFHRYIWHAKGIHVRGRFFNNSVAKMHARHHQHPEDISGFLFGPAAVFLTALMAFWIAAWISGLQLAFSVLAAYMIILLMHEWIHLLSHSKISPRSDILNEIISRHRYHHNVDPKLCFSVSQVWADKVFRTDLPDNG